MALMWMDSFDHWTTSADTEEKYAPGSGNTSIAGGSGRRGTNAASMLASGSWQLLTRPFVPAVASPTAIVGVAVQTNGLGCSFMAVRSGGTPQVTLRMDGAGFLQAMRGASNGTQIGATATTGQININHYYYIELKVVVHPTVGSIIARVNELEVLNITSVNTAPTGVASWDNIRLSTENTQSWWDDFYILDGSGAAPLNDFLGDVRVDCCRPTAEGTYSQWTPLSGTDNALMVDEAAPNDDTDYNAAPTAGLIDTYVFQDAPLPGAPIYGAQLAINWKKSDAGTCSLATVCRHGSTDYIGETVNIGTSYMYKILTFPTTPSGEAWTEANFNAVEFGVKRIT